MPGVISRHPELCQPRTEPDGRAHHGEHLSLRAPTQRADLDRAGRLWPAVRQRA